MKGERDEQAPTVETIWDRTHTARKAGRVCDQCREFIEPGQRYTSTGMKVDGVFEIWTRHQDGERHPSGCPKWRERDLAELNEQFARDEALFDGTLSQGNANG